MKLISEIKLTHVQGAASVADAGNTPIVLEAVRCKAYRVRCTAYRVRWELYNNAAFSHGTQHHGVAPAERLPHDGSCHFADEHHERGW